MRASGRFRAEGSVQREPQTGHVVFGMLIDGAVEPGMRATGPGDRRGLWGADGSLHRLGGAARPGRVRIGLVFAEEWPRVEEVLVTHDHHTV